MLQSLEQAPDEVKAPPQEGAPLLKEALAEDLHEVDLNLDIQISFPVEKMSLAEDTISISKCSQLLLQDRTTKNTGNAKDSAYKDFSVFDSKLT
ncbi:hypothetical protein AgCh_012351 [Apium graveolens]